VWLKPRDRVTCSIEKLASSPSTWPESAQDPATWWHRELPRDWIPPLAADDRRLREFPQAYGWLD
jgi:hypothetical protein